MNLRQMFGNAKTTDKCVYVSVHFKSVSTADFRMATHQSALAKVCATCVLSDFFTLSLLFFILLVLCVTLSLQQLFVHHCVKLSGRTVRMFSGSSRVNCDVTGTQLPQCHDQLAQH